MRTSQAITSVVVASVLSACFGSADGGGGNPKQGNGGQAADDAQSTGARVYAPSEFRAEFVDENACVDFSPCESDYDGTWEWTGLTFCEDITDSLNPMIDEPACRDSFLGLSIDHEGTVEIEEMGPGCYGPGSVTAALTVTARIQITQTCASALGLDGDVVSSCPELSQAFSDVLAEDMIMGGCKAQAGSCVCDLTTPTMEVFRAGVCNPDVVDYSCVENGVWTLESGLIDAGLDFVIELTRVGGGTTSTAAPQPSDSNSQSPSSMAPQPGTMTTDPPAPDGGCLAEADCPAGNACILACEQSDGTPQTTYVGQCWPSDQLVVLTLGPCSGRLASDPEPSATTTPSTDPVLPPVDINELLGCDTTVESVTTCGDVECPPLDSFAVLACGVTCCTTEGQCGVRNTSTALGSTECAASDAQCPLPPELAFGAGAGFVGCCMDDGTCGIGLGDVCMGYDTVPPPFAISSEPAPCDPAAQ